MGYVNGIYVFEADQTNHDLASRNLRPLATLLRPDQDASTGRPLNGFMQLHFQIASQEQAVRAFIVHMPALPEDTN